MRGLRLALAALVVAAIPLLAARPAHAALAGPCQASGTVKSSGKTYDPRTVDNVTLPLKGNVAWKGSVTSPDGKRSIAGAVRVRLPWPLPKARIGTWNKQSDAHATSGLYHYDFPAVMGGFDIPLTGAHTEPGVVCGGAVIVRFEGGGISNPAVIGSLVLTIISGFGLFVAFAPRMV